MPPALSLSVDTSEGRRRFELLTSAWKDLTPVLRVFEQYKRERVQAIFDAQGPNWPARKVVNDDVIARREVEIRARSVSSLRTTLIADIRRANRRIESGKGKVTALLKSQRRLQQFEEMAASGAIDFAELAGKTRSGTVDQRFYRRNPRAIARYQDAAELSKRLLGLIPQSIVSKIEKGLLVIESRIPWAGVHNEGGTVGRGAEVPARPFLFWDDIDLAFLVFLLREAGLVAMGA